MKKILYISLLAFSINSFAIPVEQTVKIPKPIGLLYACVKKDGKYIGIYSIGRAWSRKVVTKDKCSQFIEKD